MRYFCALSLLILAGGCAGSRVKAVTGPTGNPSYSITCHQDRGLCYRTAYDTCKGGYYILDAASVTRGGTGRHTPTNQDRPGSASQEHTLLVQCTGSGPAPDPMLATYGGPSGVVSDQVLLADPANPGTPGVTVLPPARKQVRQRRQHQRDPYLSPYDDPTRRRPSGYYGRQGARHADPYRRYPDATTIAPYSEYAVPPYPGRGRYYRKYRRRRKPRRKKKAASTAAPQKKAAPATQNQADCDCP